MNGNHDMIEDYDAVPLEYAGHQAMKDLAATLATIRSAIEGRAVEVAKMPDGWKAYGAS